MRVREPAVALLNGLTRVVIEYCRTHSSHPRQCLMSNEDATDGNQDYRPGLLDRRHNACTYVISRRTQKKVQNVTRDMQS